MYEQLYCRERRIDESVDEERYVKAVLLLAKLSS